MISFFLSQKFLILYIFTLFLFLSIPFSSFLLPELLASLLCFAVFTCTDSFIILDCCTCLAVATNAGREGRLVGHHAAGDEGAASEEDSQRHCFL